MIFFTPVAEELLKRMGHSSSVPGAVLAKDVPLALLNLTKAIQKEPTGIVPGPVDPNAESAVSLAHRALPLIALLQAAVDKDCDVLWS